jgi:zinc protease
MLQDISNYEMSKTYIADEENIVREMTLERHKELANKYLDANKMGYLVVGDAATQFEKLKELGFDEVILMDNDGNEIKPVKQ